MIGIQARHRIVVFSCGFEFIPICPIDPMAKINGPDGDRPELKELKSHVFNNTSCNARYLRRIIEHDEKRHHAASR